MEISQAFGTPIMAKGNGSSRHFPARASTRAGGATAPGVII